MNIKTKPSHRIIAVFFTITFLQTFIPYNNLWANNNGPNAPEAAAFEPVSATDMVNLATGDGSYVMPLLDMDGFPITLSYHSGIAMDLESSWVGLGWNINTGAINRGLSGIPDDWNDGKSLDFISYQEVNESYSINVGVGISQIAEVGIGVSWGSNKSVSGSVYGTLGINDVVGISGSLDTEGNYSVGIGIGNQDYNVGVGLSVSGNFGNDDLTYGVGLNIGTSAAHASVGFSFNDSGSALSIGGGGGNLSGTGLSSKGVSGGGGISSGSFSSGDYDIDTEGFYIPIQIYMFNISFGYQKQTFTLKKGYPKIGNGILYANQSIDTDTSMNASGFIDHQDRYRYGDTFEQPLPVSEKEFIGDYRLSLEKANFSHSNYDTYEVNASGIAGRVYPWTLQNATLFGLGYYGSDTFDENAKMRMYYHNSLTSNRTFGTNVASTNSTDFRFYFNGQFTQNTAINPLSLRSNPVAAHNTFAKLMTSGANSINTRRKSGNFVEVFTNKQIYQNNAIGLMRPESLPNIDRNGNEFKDDGIGAYKVTAPDGKTYHFSLPVYHYEMVKRTLIENNSEEDVNEQRQYTPYATHWLLSAITGPDFIDRNNNGMPDESDYGTWVRLDHGKWSDAYIWRNPAKADAKNYNTNIEGEIETKDYGYYQFGRKQIYYLDKIVTRNNTAYFVKDIRHDAAGAYNANNDAIYTYRYSPPQGGAVPNIQGGASIVGENGIHYKREYQLLLDKIVIVRNENGLGNKNINPSKTLNTLNLNGYIKDDAYKPAYNPSGDFYTKEYGSYPNYDIHNESGVYDITDFENFDYSKALKVVQFDYDYNLATASNSSQYGSPSSIITSKNPYRGKLKLKSIQTKGRNNTAYMPPYQFEYIGERDGLNAGIPYPANANPEKLNETYTTLFKAKDEWGYLKNNPEAWSLNKITTPTGGTIEIEYEEDDYYTEAFSRRYWSENLRFIARPTSDNQFVDITIEKQLGLIFDLKFDEYFYVNQPVLLDLWISREYRIGIFGGGQSDVGNLDITASNNTIVTSVSPTQLVIRVPNQNILTGPEPYNSNTVLNRHFSTTEGSNVYQPAPRGTEATAAVPGIGNSTSEHNMSYKLLANRVPVDQTGGGLRVKSITTVDESNNRYKSSYFYNQPGTNEAKNQGDYRSSGITSYAPVNGLKFIPYQSELPGPGVMYEYVTMRNESGNVPNKSLGSTRYQFYTIQPVRDIFNPNLEMNLDDGTTIFETSVTDHTDGSNTAYYYPAQKVKAKSIKVSVNTSMIGQFRKVEEFNNKDQLLKRTKRNYINGETLKNSPSYNKGTVQESFQTMKSIFKTNIDDQNPILRERLLSISTKENYTSALNEVKVTNQFGTITQSFSNGDPETGNFRTTITKFGDTKEVKTDQIPAYTKYPEMGSKAVNFNNKHMLTQKAMDITSVKTNNTWGVIDASITTWNNTWNYRNSTGNESTETDVWRSHKSYIWQEDVSSNGIFTTSNLNENNFNWSLAPTVTPADQWRKVSEITRYSHNSVPLETKDINDNFGSSKMSIDNSRILTASNSRYSEFYYSGAEDVVSGNIFEGEVLGATYRTQEDAHTGVWSVKNTTTNAKVFELQKSVNSSIVSGDFRPGTYKVSFWTKTGNTDGTDDGTRLVFNGTTLEPDEKVVAGCWILNNFIIDIPSSASQLNLYATNISSASNFFDDFRIHPVSSSMLSYVYHQETNQLIAILNANNLSAKYCYDTVGRLCTTYAEVPDQDEYTGGFKVTSRNKYNYKGIETNDFGCICELNICDNPDYDGDGILNQSDNCPNTYNQDQADNDNDNLGDVCDPDDDNDGILDNAPDNCLLISNPDQADNDDDGIGDACDPDDDNDGVLDASDNCQFTYNPNQEDVDNDGQGDACDYPEGIDTDGDGIEDLYDDCDAIANACQLGCPSPYVDDAECSTPPFIRPLLTATQIACNPSYAGQEYNTGVFPANGAVNVNQHISLQMDFENPNVIINSSWTHPLNVVKSSNNEVVASMIPKAIVKSNGISKAIFPPLKLEPNTSYYVQVGHSLFKNSIASNWVCMTQPWQFTTDSGTTTKVAFVNIKNADFDRLGSYGVKARFDSNSGNFGDGIYDNGYEVPLIGNETNVSTTDFTGAQEFGRGFLYFNTEAIPDNAIINSVNLKFHVRASNNSDNIKIKVSKGYQQPLTSGHAFSLPFKAFDQSTVGEVSIPKNIVNWTEFSTPINISLNSINKKGLTKFSLRESHDFNYVQTPGFSGNHAAYIWTGNFVGTGSNEGFIDKLPVLEINYTIQ